jgi:hypothetical protein
MLAVERGLKLVDAMQLDAAESSCCDFFITNDLGFRFTGSMDVEQLTEFVKKFELFRNSNLIRFIIVRIRTEVFNYFVYLVIECIRALILR